MSEPADRKTNRQEEIIEAAVKLFSDNGFHNTAVQRLADAVGLNKATLYYHIHSKEELLYRIHRAIIDDFLTDLEAICAQPNLTPTDRLHRAIQAHIRHVAERQAEVKIFFRERDSIGEEMRVRIAERRRRYQDLLVAIIEEGMAAGEFRDVDAKVVASFIVGMSNWLYQWYEPGGRLTADEIAKAASEFALAGLRAIDG